MGIYCEINLFKPADGAFAPGSTVSGAIKYALDEETEFKNVIVSLKGNGRLEFTSKHNRNGSRSRTRHGEDYVDIDHYVVQNQDKVATFPIGSYEIPFSFTLPNGIPASLKYIGSSARFSIKCKIQYYIRIKFAKSGVMSFDKKFKKEITVISGITPTLSVEPVMHGERKILTKLFSSKKSIVNIKAVIKNCVITPGENIEFDYEVTNDTKITVKSIESKLIEAYTFTNIANKEKNYEDVINTDSKTGSVKSGEIKNMSIVMPVPSDRSSLENSKIVSRKYIVRIIAELPLPHRNAVLDIPVQIGNTIVEVGGTDDEQPPTYWEAMGEEKGDGDYDIEDDNVDKS